MLMLGVVKRERGEVSIHFCLFLLLHSFAAAAAAAAKKKEKGEEKMGS